MPGKCYPLPSTSMGRNGQHAVVIGASIAGLCAARVLSDFYDRVTLYERDDLPDEPANRTAVPARQTRPSADGARRRRNSTRCSPVCSTTWSPPACRFWRTGPTAFTSARQATSSVRRTTLRDEFTAYVPSSPHLEWQIRRRATAIATSTSCTPASPSRFDATRQQVTGVRLETGDEVPADLVVDTAGRGTRLPAWLEQWGFDRPPRGQRRRRHQLRHPPAAHPRGLIAEKVVVAGAHGKQPLGLGMLCYEDGTWALTTFGVAKAEPPHDFAGMCALADEVVPSHIAAAIRSGRTDRRSGIPQIPDQSMAAIPQARPLPRRDPAVRRRRRQLQSHLRAGNDDDLATGGYLRRALESPDPDLAATFNKATAKSTYPVWTMNAIGDLVMHGASGPMPWWYRPVGGLFDQFLGAAETDPVLAEWFLRRFSLLDSLYMVPSTKLVGRTIRHNMRLLVAEKRTASRSAHDRDLVPGR